MALGKQYRRLIQRKVRAEIAKHTVVRQKLMCLCDVFGESQLEMRKAIDTMFKEVSRTEQLAFRK